MSGSKKIKIDKEIKKMGRPARTIEMQKFACELPTKLTKRIRDYCYKKGLIINKFVEEAIELKFESLKDGD